MKRVGDISLMLYITLIYAVTALFLPALLEQPLDIIRDRIKPGNVDALESVIYWPLIAGLVVIAAIVPALMLIWRFSKSKLLIRALTVSITSELLISIFLMWLVRHEVPSGYGYPALSSIISLNADDLSLIVPHIAYVSYSAIIRVIIFPAIAIGFARMMKIMAQTHPRFKWLNNHG
jgi:hypothetical protein